MRIIAFISILLLAGLPCHAQPEAGTKLATAIYLTAAAENITSPTLSFGDSAKRFYDGMLDVTIASDQIDTTEKVAIAAAIGYVSNGSNTPESAEDSANRLVALLQSGTWDDIGAPSSVLGTPTPELRALLLTMLSKYVGERYMMAMTTLASQFP